MTHAWHELVEQLRLELLVQLLMAVILGGAVGLERELKGKPAGLRTTILITMGATLFTVLSYKIGSGTGDPGRIAAQVLTGIGFIGAGTILQYRGSVRGLTTAASLWAVAAIGTAAGAGMLVMALVGTVLILVVLQLLDTVESFARRRLNIPTEKPKPGEDAGEGRTEDMP